MATKCPITRKEFNDNAAPMTAEIGGQTVTLNPKEFSTGSFGFGYSGKITVEIAGKPVVLQVGCNVTAVGSKDAQ